MRHIEDLLAPERHAELVGREQELATLQRLLRADGPRVVHAHGIAGIGKSSLLTMFAAWAVTAGHRVLAIDCRSVEPTPTALLQEAARQLDLPILTLSQLASHGGNTLWLLDNYESFRLLDSWLRQTFAPALPASAGMVLASREPPQAAWLIAAGWHELFQPLPLEALESQHAAALHVPRAAIPTIVGHSHGHPLALRLAAATCYHHPELALSGIPLQQALEQLVGLFHSDVPDPDTRLALEAACVTRRATVSLLQALLPQLDATRVFEQLQRLPFVSSREDGLTIHDVVRDGIVSTLQAHHPAALQAYRLAAWQQLRREVAASSQRLLWRYTADMLYLIENPVLREAFFPRDAARLAVEPATATDGDAITRLAERHDGAQATAQLRHWWQRQPQAFAVVRDHDGRVVGFHCTLHAGQVPPAQLQQDPVTAAWWQHLQQQPLADGQQALFCRRWLSWQHGEAPSPEQAACWLDLKRSYMELRPTLRRVYLTLRDPGPYAAAAQRLGFVMLPQHGARLDGQDYGCAMLDFGPDSVDGWLARLAAAELGLPLASSLLDLDARELVLDGRRVTLTPLEFGVFAHLYRHQDKAVSRSELLQAVWNTHYQGGSNVTDTVVCALRRKLGTHAHLLETVTGVGYRLRGGPHY